MTTRNDLVQRLVKHRTLGSAPPEQLEWLAAHGQLQRFEIGDVVSQSSEPIHALYIVLSGHFSIRVDRGAGPRKVMEWSAGDVSGLLPFSRMQSPPGTTTVDEPVEMLAVDREHFPEMISRCHEVTAILVHVMLDRARRFTKADLHDEKLLSLGRLSAGLAHELNNPASALARSARELSARVFQMEASSLALGGEHLSAEQLKEIGRVRTLCNDPGARAALTPLERSDREEAVGEWLTRHRLSAALAEDLAETALTPDALDRLADSVGSDALPFALRSIGASCRTRLLASEVEIAARRIHELVAAIKSFTHMDQANVAEPVAIGRGLSDSVAMLSAKARAKSLTVTLEVAEDLPIVHGFGGELNQVWMNLIDNAIDAAPASGTVEVKAGCRGDKVLVTVVDDGPGVPPEKFEKIFEPFYTTKAVGQGTGLGLDIVRRLVQQHDGHIEVDSRPGRTVFRVILPRVKAQP
jgi:signal transduction histidine kinase